MVHMIEEDSGRFKEIVRGKARENLSKHLSNRDIVIPGRHGKKGKISVPVPQVDIPRFRFEDKQKGGVGQGEGEEGDPLGPPEGDEDGKASDQEGDHAIEVEYTLEEWADIIGEDLELEMFERGSKNIIEYKNRYTGIRKVGSESLRHTRRTYKAALKRQLASGEYDPKDPRIIPVKEDRRYRSARRIPEERAQAVAIYMMDVSGSMGDEQKEIVRTISNWIDLWIARNHRGLERRFIIHDAAAREVNREIFFTTKESGGTVISSAYRLCYDIIKSDYPVADWNIFPFHFSDGDNWTREDDNLCVQILRNGILPFVNRFFYAQVHSPHGSGTFMHIIKKLLIPNISEELGGKIRKTHMNSRDDILQGMKDLLGKQKQK